MLGSRIKLGLLVLGAAVASALVAGTPWGP
jgi:hypothetical protein